MAQAVIQLITDTRCEGSEHLPWCSRLHGWLLQFHSDCLWLCEWAVVASEQQTGEQNPLNQSAVNFKLKILCQQFFPYPTYGSFRIAGESFELMDGLLGMAITNKPLRRTDSGRSLLFHALASATENAVELSVLNNSTVWMANQGMFMFPERFNIIGNRDIQTGG